jgi:hypothetical protein
VRDEWNGVPEYERAGLDATDMEPLWDAYRDDDEGDR